jgi:CMP-N-acetylneuraminic acid synthetase
VTVPEADELQGGVWAIIPARGGSKGIPRKNLTPVGGASLLARAVQACISSRSITRTIVSTDDPEIAEVGEGEGATVVWRPPELASDTASSESAVEHAISSLVTGGFPLPRYSLLVQCTSPFLSAGDLDAIVRLLESGDVETCFTAVRSHRFLWKLDSSGAAVAVNHDPSRRLPRQSLRPEFVETGAAYGFVTAGFLEANSRFFGRTGIVEVDSRRAIEIDDSNDLAMARALDSFPAADGG